ncbi:MAG TPA: hypothetical protein VGM98_24910 [Schlesneria sp.]
MASSFNYRLTTLDGPSTTTAIDELEWNKRITNESRARWNIKHHAQGAGFQAG